MVSLPEKYETINSNKRNLFEENKIFCDICKLWICGIAEIDNHFIVHSFKTWPAAAQRVTLNEVLVQKTESLAAYKNRLSDASKINITDIRIGKQQQLLRTLFDCKGYAEKIHKYYEDDEDTLHNSDDQDDDDTASIATTVRREDHLSSSHKQKNIVIERREHIAKPKRFANKTTVHEQKREKVKIKTELPYLIDLDNSTKMTENSKYPTSEKNENVVCKKEILQLQDDLITEKKDYSEDSDKNKSSLIVPIDFFQNDAQNYHPLMENTNFDLIHNTEKLVHIADSPLELSKNSPLPSPLSKNRDIKRNSHLKTVDVDVPSKKAKLQKEEIREKQNKNRKSLENTNKIVNRPSWALDRYTIIQPFSKGNKNISSNMSNADSPLESVKCKPKAKSKDRGKESMVNSSKNETIPTEKDTPNKLILKKSFSIIQTEEDQLNEKKAFVAEKLPKKKKTKGINQLEEYIRMKEKSESPLTPDEIRHLRLIRQEIIVAPSMRKPSTEIEEAMASTYNLRFTELRVNAMTIKDALKIFYGLQNYNLLKSEFERCTHRSLKLLPQRLNKFFDEMILKEKRFWKLSDKYTVCKKAMDKLNQSQRDSKLQQNVGMILFGYKVTKGNWQGPLFHCRKKEETVILEKPTPFIDVVKGDLWTPYKKMDLYVERVKVGSAQSFYDAIIMAYVLYWVFNLEYDDSLRPVFEYFDWIVGNPQNTYK